MIYVDNSITGNNVSFAALISELISIDEPLISAEAHEGSLSDRISIESRYNAVSDLIFAAVYYGTICPASRSPLYASSPSGFTHFPLFSSRKLTLHKDDELIREVCLSAK